MHSLSISISGLIIRTCSFIFFCKETLAAHAVEFAL